MHTDWASKHHNTFLHSFPLIGISFSCCLSKINSKMQINLDASKFCWCDICIYGFFFRYCFPPLSVRRSFDSDNLFMFCYHDVPILYIFALSTHWKCLRKHQIHFGWVFFNSFCVWPDGFKALFILMSFGLYYNERQKGF